MGRNKNNKSRQKSVHKKGPVGIWMDAPPLDPDDYAEYLAKIAASRQLQLVSPLFEVAEVIKHFAKANALQVNDATDKFPAGSNRDPKKALEFNTRLSLIAMADPKTVYFYTCNEYNADACRIVGYHILLSQRRELMVGFNLAFMVFLGDNFVYGPVVDNRRQLLTHLSALLDSWACCLCLDDLEDITHAIVCWECHHSLCGKCVESEAYGQMVEANAKCPMCEAPAIERTPIHTVFDWTKASCDSTAR